MGAGDETPRSGGIFIFSAGSNIHTLDPHFAYDTLSTAACRLLYDGLLDYDYDGDMTPSLAASLPEISDDGRVFRFTLRDGIKFHNGREVTAEDISWSMHRLLSERIGSPGYPFFKSIEGAPAYHAGKTDEIEGIVVLGPKTIEFRLDEADQTFLNAIAMPFAYPMAREHVEALEKAEGRTAVGRNPIGTGPFSLRRWERGVQVEFERFDDYWDPRARPDQMVFLENISADVASARFRNGGVDIIYRPSKVNRLFLRDSEAWAPYRAEAPSPSVFALGLNCELPPFDNIHVRKAIAFAIDRSKLERLDPGKVIAATQVLPPMLPPHDPDLPQGQMFDLERAKEEMRLAGYPDGLPEPVLLWVRGEGEVHLAQFFQQDLKAIGIDIELKLVTFATYLKETGRPRVAQAAFTGWHLKTSRIPPTSWTSCSTVDRSIRRTPKTVPSIATTSSTRFSTRRARRSIGRYDSSSTRRPTPSSPPTPPGYFSTTPSRCSCGSPMSKISAPTRVWLNEYRNIWLDLPKKRVSQDIYAQEATR